MTYPGQNQEVETQNKLSTCCCRGTSLRRVVFDFFGALLNQLCMDGPIQWGVMPLDKIMRLLFCASWLRWRST